MSTRQYFAYKEFANSSTGGFQIIMPFERFRELHDEKDNRLIPDFKDWLSTHQPNRFAYPNYIGSDIAFYFAKQEDAVEFKLKWL